MDKRIVFIGGGNMGAAIIGGLIKKGFSASSIVVSEPFEESRQKLQAQFGIKTTGDNAQAISWDRPADIVILAVKPQIMAQVAAGIAPVVQKVKPLVTSIAAGVTLASLGKWLCSDADGNLLPNASLPSMVRVMPNTPALVSEGATGLFATSEVSAEQKALCETVLRAVSPATCWVDKEELIDVVTALSGSGPAYFFLLVESLVDAATKLGLPQDVALQLATQTCLGAGKMLCETKEMPSDLRRKVTSPNGTTDAAIKSFEANGLRDICDKAVQAANKRGQELGAPASK